MKGWYNENNKTIYIFPQTAAEIPYVDPSAEAIAVQQENIDSWKEENPTVADMMVTYNYYVMTVQPKVWSEHTDEDIEPPYVPVSPELEWSAASASAQIGETNTYPTLTNPHSVTVSYTSSDTEKATINQTTGEVTLVAAGTTTISAVFAGDDTYEAQTVNYTLTVIAAKVSPNLAWSAASATATIGDTNTFPTLTNPNSVTVTYTSSDTSAATINQNTGEITLVTAGTTTISAVFAGDDTYEAQTVTYTLTVAAHDYSEDYLTFEALEDGTFTFSTNDLQYSLDDGSTWTTLTAGTASPTVTTGNKILWKATGLTPSTSGIGRFSATGNFKAYGNVMSLYYGDNFVGETDLTGKNYAFYQLFYDNTKIINAENLSLLAITLSQHCYEAMLSRCTSLTTAPELPAITLATNCYDSMFSRCTSLTTVHELPATTLANSCYYNMFGGCTSLTTAPTLPATTLANSCYWNMFSGCTSLVTAPELKATTLAINCYNTMFSGCTSLNSITCLATNISANNCTSDWLTNVAASGTFIKDASMSSWTTGNDGIPSGWTTEDYAPL